MRKIFVFFLLAGCAHKQEMHPLQVQTSIAYSCWKNQSCVDEVTECFDIEISSYYSKLNVAERDEGIFCQQTRPVFDERTTIKNCVKAYQKSRQEFK